MFAFPNFFDVCLVAPKVPTLELPLPVRTPAVEAHFRFREATAWKISKEHFGLGNINYQLSGLDTYFQIGQ